MKRNSSILYMIGLVMVPALSSAQTWLSSAPTAVSYYGGALVNFTNDSSSDLVLTGLFDLNLSGAGGFTNSYQVYTKNGALSGVETNAAAWNLLGTANVSSTNPQGTFTTINVGNTFTVSAGQTIGLAFFLTTPPDSGGNFPSGGFVGYNQGASTFTDGTATITTGLAKGYRGGFDSSTDLLFNVDTFSPRAWSGRVQYAAVPEPASLAAIGIFTVGLIRRRKKQK